MPASTGSRNGNGLSVQSVDRAVSILEFLAHNGWSGVTEVGRALGVHKSTAFRLLATLQGRGLVEQHDDTGKYHLGFGLVHLARAVTVGFDLKRVARPVCERLAEETDETVMLAVLDGDEVMNIDAIIPRTQSVVSMGWLGRRTPLHCTANGKALLAWLPEGHRQRIVATSFERFTPNTIVRPSELEAQLELVRRDGYAVAVEEYEEGLNAAAAPIRSPDGELLGAMSVSGPSYRATPEHLPDLGKAVRSAAAAVTGRGALSVSNARG